MAVVAVVVVAAARGRVEGRERDDTGNNASVNQRVCTEQPRGQRTRAGLDDERAGQRCGSSRGSRCGTGALKQ